MAQWYFSTNLPPLSPTWFLLSCCFNKYAYVCSINDKLVGHFKVCGMMPLEGLASPPAVSGTQNVLALCTILEEVQDHRGSQSWVSWPIILLTEDSSVLGGSCAYKEVHSAQNHSIQEVTVMEDSGSAHSISAQTTSVLWDALHSLCNSLPKGSKRRARTPIRNVCTPGFHPSYLLVFGFLGSGSSESELCP